MASWSLGGCVLDRDPVGAGTLVIDNEDARPHAVTVVVRKTSDDDDDVPPRPREAPAPTAQLQWRRRATFEATAGNRLREAAFITTPGAFYIEIHLETDARAATWLGLYPAGPDGQRIAEAFLAVDIDTDGRVTVQPPVDDYNLDVSPLLFSGMATSRVRAGLDWRWPTLPQLVVLVGFGLVGIGAVLPWATKTIPIKVYILGMESGLERIWVRRLLAVTGVGILVAIARFVASGKRPVLDLALVGIGGTIALITVGTSPLTSSWTPARGVYLTLVGGVLVTIGSAISFVRTWVDTA